MSKTGQLDIEFYKLLDNLIKEEENLKLELEILPKKDHEVHKY